MNSTAEINNEKLQRFMALSCAIISVFLVQGTSLSKLNQKYEKRPFMQLF